MIGRVLADVKQAVAGYELNPPTTVSACLGVAVEVVAIPLLVTGSIVGAGAVLGLMGYGILHDIGNNLRGIRKDWYT